MNTLIAPNVPIGSVLFLQDTNQGTVQTIVLDTDASARAAIVGAVPVWWVDANTTAPLDRQTGLTPATAFGTTEQLSATLCPGGAVYTPKQNVTINLAAGAYGKFYVNLCCPGFTVLLLGTHSQSAPIGLVDVQPPGPGTTPILGPFTEANGTRVRVLTGPAAGAITYLLLGVPAPGNQRWVQPTYRESNGSIAFPVSGNQVQTEVITTSLQRIDIDSALVSGVPGNGAFTVRDINGFLTSCRVRASGLNVTFSECGFNVQLPITTDGPAVDYVNCTNSQPLTLIGSVHNFTGHCNRSTIQAVNATVRMLSQCSSTGGNFNVSMPQGLGSVGRAALVFVGDYSCEGGGGAITLINLGPGGDCYVNARLYGSGFSPFASIASMTSGAWLYLQNKALIGLGSIIVGDFVITGHAPVPLANVPICYPRANCGVALISDPAAAAQST
jgi:hypothetical protein